MERFSEMHEEVGDVGSMWGHIGMVKEEAITIKGFLLQITKEGQTSANSESHQLSLNA